MITVGSDTTPRHALVVVHLREHPNSDKPCSVFVHLVLEAVEGRAQFGWTDDSQRLIQKARSQKRNVALRFSKGVKMFVVGL